jgi:hypothetical protein
MQKVKNIHFLPGTRDAYVGMNSTLQFDVYHPEIQTMALADSDPSYPPLPSVYSAEDHMTRHHSIDAEEA